MTAFWVISALFVAGALLFVMPPLLAHRERVRFSRSATNLAIHRDELRELDGDIRAGTLDAEHYEKARRELEARLLEDVADDDAVSTPPRRGHGAAIAAGFAIPLFALALYFVVGNPQAIVSRQAANQGGAAHALSAQQVEALVARLAARMRQNPEDADGWIMLGRSYRVLGRFDQAAQAYTNAVARLPRDAGLLADYADMLAMAQGRRLQGEPERLIARALEADPNNLKALALAGTAAFEKQDYAGAVRHWERMLPLVPPDSDDARSIQASIAEARSLGGAPPGGRATRAR
ncbi:MAG: c-type cytochrome biogenesis protein CcmI [Betaproteobacteria bacterium RIFCSPLOWO2_12_FULL_62_58]|nr:MAG: c-type cytochrome biogenesis protein CcmI [Betaproteobacteria bacterium RIFCSPLOWO2_12_FULL_62_58]